MADADQPVQRLRLQAALQIDQLSLGAAAPQIAVLDRRHAGRVITAIFQPLQRIDDQRRDRRLADNSNNSAHKIYPNSRQMKANGYLRRAAPRRKSLCVSLHFNGYDFLAAATIADCD